MRIRLDWKFLLPLIISVVGVLVTVWIWQADLNGKSLSVKLVSRASLEPTGGRPVPEMEISIDGAKLLNPYVVTFEITNEGRKPIHSSDFESPIEIRLESSTSFVRPKITASTPKDIDAELAVEQKKIGLKPLLLNPQDSIVITAITTGEAPLFASKARISGISLVALQDGTQEKKSGAKGALLLLVAIALFIVSGIGGVGSWPSKGVWVAPLPAMFIQIGTSVPSAIILLTALAEFGIDSLAIWVSTGLAVLLVSSQIGSLWVRWAILQERRNVKGNNQAKATEQGTMLPVLPSASPPLAGPTPIEISESIDEAPPLQREKILHSLVGLHVVWDTTYRSGSLREGNSVRLVLKPEEGSTVTTIWCEVPLLEYGELGGLHEGAKIRVSGEIAEVTRFDVELKNVLLYIYQN